MIRIIILTLALTLGCVPTFGKKVSKDLWPDGTEISAWFKETTPVDLSKLGKQYRITDYGVVNDGRIHTKDFQALIDMIAKNGGGVVIVPEGTYLTGALFFRQGVHLHINDGGMILGSNLNS